MVDIGMCFATLFRSYPFFGFVRDDIGQCTVRGIYTIIATLGGLMIMRQGGPIQFVAVSHRWGRAVRNCLIGLLVGIPLAVLNVYALQFTEGQSVHWKSPLASLLDSLQPAIVVEIIYRFALWGLLWLLLKKSFPNNVVGNSAITAMLFHSYAHFDVQIVQSPMIAVGTGLVISLIWGLPLTLLARHRGVESAIAFHWVEDGARFLTGF